MSIWVAGIAAAATVGSSVIASNSAKKAQESQERQAQAALDAQGQAQEKAEERLNPFIEPSMGALRGQQALTGLLGPEAQAQARAGLESPTTQKLREEGFRAIDTRLASQGRLGGSGRLKRFIELSNLIDQQTLGDQFNRLGAISGLGASVAGNLSGLGANAALGQAGTSRQLGQAQAQGQQARGQAFSSGLEGLGGIAAGFFQNGQNNTSGSPQTEETNFLAGMDLG